jgi:hypothetical protein
MPSRGNPLPVPTDCAGYLIKRTHDMVRLDLPQQLRADKQRVFTQSYCRFQVNFAYVSDATQFINAIRPVCPCKEIAGGPPPPPPSITVNKSLVPRSVFLSKCCPYAHQLSLPSHQRPAAASTARERNQYGRTQSSLPQQPRRALPEGVALPTPFKLGSIPGAIIRSRTSDAPVLRQVIPTVVVAATRDAFQPIHGARQQGR